MAPRETANNAYAKFWGDKQRPLWYVMVFLEWPIVIDTFWQGNYAKLSSGPIMQQKGLFCGNVCSFSKYF